MSPILKIILSRLAMGILTLLIVSLLIFSAIELLPGDIATETLGQSANAETITAFKERFNLNGPVHMRSQCPSRADISTCSAFTTAGFLRFFCQCFCIVW